MTPKEKILKKALGDKCWLMTDSETKKRMLEAMRAWKWRKKKK